MVIQTVANLSTKIRTTLFGLVLLSFAGQAGAKSIKDKNRKGTGEGLLNEDPEWAAGVEFGAYRVTGIGVQRMGFGSGALNLAAGFVFGEMALQGNYLLFLNTDFKFIRMSPKKRFGQHRGKTLLYGGPGGILGDGMSIHLPVGMQYMMLKDPILFFGEIGATLGPFGGDAENGTNITWALGIKVLL